MVLMNSCASVVISTRNRRDELKRAVESACRQMPPFEVIVIDDGSTDGTSEMVRHEFPSVRLVHHEESAGYIVRRNEGMRIAKTPIVFVIDDDAEFISHDTIAKTLIEFSDPRIGAVAIPFVDIKLGPGVKQMAPSPDGIWITFSFVGTAHALRRDLFLSLGGYWDRLFHQGEEGEYCLRMMEAGYYVRLGNADPILHYYSPKRSLTRLAYYGKRNTLMSGWRNVPWPYLPIHLAGAFVKGFWHGLKVGEYVSAPRGVIAGAASIIWTIAERKPVSRRTYRFFRNLWTEGPQQLR